MAIVGLGRCKPIVKGASERFRTRGTSIDMGACGNIKTSEPAYRVQLSPDNVICGPIFQRKMNAPRPIYHQAVCQVHTVSVWRETSNLRSNDGNSEVMFLGAVRPRRTSFAYRIKTGREAEVRQRSIPNRRSRIEIGLNPSQRYPEPFPLCSGTWSAGGSGLSRADKTRGGVVVVLLLDPLYSKEATELHDRGNLANAKPL